MLQCIGIHEVTRVVGTFCSHSSDLFFFFLPLRGSKNEIKENPRWLTGAQTSVTTRPQLYVEIEWRAEYNSTSFSQHKNENKKYVTVN